MRTKHYTWSMETSHTNPSPPTSDHTAPSNTNPPPQTSAGAIRHNNRLKWWPVRFLYGIIWYTCTTRSARVSVALFFGRPIPARIARQSPVNQSMRSVWTDGTSELVSPCTLFHSVSTRGCVYTRYRPIPYIVIVVVCICGCGCVCAWVSGFVCECRCRCGIVSSYLQWRQFSHFMARTSLFRYPYIAIEIS